MLTYRYFIQYKLCIFVNLYQEKEIVFDILWDYTHCYGYVVEWSDYNEIDLQPTCIYRLYKRQSAS